MVVNNGSHIRLLVTQFTKSLTFNKNFQCSCQICFKPLRGWGYVHRGLVPHSVSTNTTSYYNNATRAFLNISGTVVLFYPVRLVFEAAFFCLLRRSQWYWKTNGSTWCMVAFGSICHGKKKQKKTDNVNKIRTSLGSVRVNSWKWRINTNKENGQAKGRTGS